MRKQRLENPKRLQNYHFTKDYGITIDERDEKLEKQKNLRAVCKRLMDSPCVDHDHETNEARGLLCRWCNTVLGHVREQIDTLLNAAEYLRKYKKVEA